MHFLNYRWPIEYSEDSEPVENDIGIVSIAAVNPCSEPIQMRLIIVPYLDQERMDVEFGEMYSGKEMWKLPAKGYLFGTVRVPLIYLISIKLEKSPSTASPSTPSLLHPSLLRF